jgi:hypothetical protein
VIKPPIKFLWVSVVTHPVNPACEFPPDFWEKVK